MSTQASVPPSWSRLARGLSFVLVSQATAAQLPARRVTNAQAIERWVQSHHQMGAFDGVILVAINGHPVYHGAFGEANREWHVPHSMDGRFRIGSITKAFTASAALQLVASGQLRLDAHVSDYLPEFPAALGSRITIDQLLTHTSGMPDVNSFPDFFQQLQAGLLSEKAILERIGRYELLSVPGTKFSYSNDNYVLLGAIMARISGSTFEATLKRLVLDPAGLEVTGMTSSSQLLPNRVDGYRRILGGVENVIPYVADASAGLYSTAGDLLKWDEALYRADYLAPAVRTRMWTLSPYGNAYGWLVSRKPVPGKPRDSLTIMKGDGAVPGFYALTLRVPRDHIFIVALTNVRGPKNYLPDIGQGILDILYGLPPGKPVRSLADVLRAEFPKASADRVIANYKRRSAEGEQYETNESHLNSVAYALLTAGRPRDAVVVFRLVSELFPSSANAYDSLGDGLLAARDSAGAASAYQHAVRLDSSMTQTAAKLRSLMPH